MTDRVTLARKLMRINERAATPNRNPSAIFGSVGDIVQSVSTRAPLRIGLWPCMSAEKPEFAMGIWSVLGHLLERWNDIEVYRLFVQLEGEPDDFVWDIDKSQFTPAEWDIEPLDENIGMWGTLEQHDSTWQLSVTIDNDNLTGEDNEPITLTTQADTLPTIINQLPAFANDIAEAIAAGREDTTDPLYTPTDADEAALLPLLKETFMWDVNLVASLYGVEWDDQAIVASFDRLVAAGKTIDDDFAAWVASKAITETMRPGYSVIGDLFIDRAANVRDSLTSLITVPVLADGVFNMGFAQRAYRILEDELEQHPTSTLAHLKLSAMYAAGGLLLDAIDQYQTAITNESTSPDLYRAYGNVMLAAERENQLPTTYVLIDTNDYYGDLPAWEAVAAYNAALAIDPTDLRSLYSSLLQLGEIAEDETQLWDGFVKLVELDETGDYVSDVIDGIYTVEDVSRGIEALEAQMAAHPDRIDLLINAGTLYLIVEDGDSAESYLKKAHSMTDDTSTLADIERLQIAVQDPQFEFKFAEMVGVLDANNSLGADDVEYLEGIVDDAPHVIDAHIALARAYYYWEETDDALEVLLDAQETVPDRPAVLDWLARILWESGEKETAFTYLNRGMRLYPFNVQLIARAGQYLFDNEQLDEARTYLSRAEDISPRHPMLRAVRAYIARRMAEDPEKYGEG